jgi:hypothetical protein
MRLVGLIILDECKLSLFGVDNHGQLICNMEYVPLLQQTAGSSGIWLQEWATLRQRR